MSPRKYSKEVIEKAKEMRKAGLSVRKIAEKLGFSDAGMVYYYISPNYKEVHNIAVRRWMKNNPEKNRLIQLKAIKKYFKTPHGMAKQKALSKERWQKTINDPILHEQYLARKREQAKERRLKLKK